VDSPADPSLSRFADHLEAPRGRGALARAPHAGAAGGAQCGDLVKIAVRVEGGAVAEAGFEASGCGAAIAAASATVELVSGASAIDAARVTPDDIASELGGLPPAKIHAATLAADALHRALGKAAADGVIRAERSERRTLVAMSGGVDSTVAALAALEAGHETIAVTLELWADPANDGERSCCSPQAVTGARALAHTLGLPHLTLDLREAFRAQVVEDFISEHAAGRTPNPCVRCNGLVRFDEMLELGAALGAARLATGHYARIERDEAGPLLAPAVDAHKDQTYMLARVPARQLERVWFPLGELTKPQVRERAGEHGLAVAGKAESQDLCFMAGTRRADFLARHGERAPSGSGELVDLEGRVVGRHDGQHRFTVGQRRGIGLAALEPLYVIAKDAPSGRVTVGPREALRTRRVNVSDARLERPGYAVAAVKLRYQSPALACRLVDARAAGAYRSLELVLDEPVEGLAPGQSAVLLDARERVVGHGLIAEPSAAPTPPARVSVAEEEQAAIAR